ncbi:MAG: DmsE family decaheme c-type cytochrome [Acidobacteria bacterium]|nr:DmsE family decaheme c-type cytochrome [Acidobacteriota bacterium]
MKQRRPTTLKLAMLATAGILAVAWWALGQERGPGVSVSGILPEASYVGVETCAKCHQEMIRPFQKTVHSKLAGFERAGEAKDCEICHGPGSQHAETRDRRRIVYYTRLSNTEKAARVGICLNCHRGEPTPEWKGSAHPMNSVFCFDCHNPHRGEAKNLLKETEPNLCFSCHREKRAQMTMPSHHPVREGRIKCTDCHNQHGSTTRPMLRAESVSQLCFRCHAEKEGPFIYEHPPVTESCTICHNPHGTVANYLLVQNQPFLCLQCHAAHVRQQLPPLLDAVDVPEKRQAFLTRCTQCHQQIHGSDLPSNSGRGRLTR